MNAVFIQAIVLAAAAIGSIYHMASGPNSPLAKYLLAWAVFHTTEYLCTLKFLPRTVSAYLFLMWGARGSVELAGVHFLAILEYVFARRFWNFRVPTLGMLLALAGTMIRGRAISDCGDSFSHYIEVNAESSPGRSGPPGLVTSGIYSWCRHPSYLGFMVYVVGMQLILGTVLVQFLCIVVLFRFFTRRIEIEEYFLVNNLYGPAYLAYKARVRALVPFIY